MTVENLSVVNSTARPLLGFSNDSLNSRLNKSPSLNKCHEADADDEEADSLKLEPLAFTIDFGDPSSSKSKKKETPKRFADRIASCGGGNGKRQPSSVQQRAKKVSW